MRTQRSRSTHLVLVLVAAALLGTHASVAWAQEFNARTDRTRMASNETLTLEVVYAERADTTAIDFERLLPDFAVLSNRPSSQTRIVNFKRTSQTSWQLTLMPKRTGRLRIPAFQIGQASTRPIDILVEAAPETPEAGAPFSAELSVDRERAFIGEQVLVRVILTAAQGLGELRGAPLEVASAETSLVHQSEFQRLIGDKAFVVTELVYAIFPQRPGELLIPPVQYTAVSGRRDFVLANTPETRLEILDPASHADARQKRPWLPADAIAIASEWSAPIDSVEVGEPITRTIRIAAASQHAAAIPPIVLPDGDYKQYAEQPILEDTETSTGILGRRTDSIVIVPTRVGELVLPPVEIDWWNIDERRWQVARLRSETLRIVPGIGAPANDLGDGSDPTPIGSPVAETPDKPTTPSRTNELTWILSLAGLSGLLFVVSVALYVRVRRLQTRLEDLEAPNPASSPGEDARAAFNRAMRSLADRNPTESRRHVLAWARLRWPTPPIQRLEEIAARADEPGLAEALATLDRSLYRPHDPSDSGDAEVIDFEALKTLLRNAQSRPDSNHLEPKVALGALYPNES